jgi:hypothetical protein
MRYSPTLFVAALLAACTPAEPPAEPVCGNGIAEEGEACDGAALGGEDCTSQGFDSGTLTCAADCLAFDFAQCVNNVVDVDPPVFGGIKAIAPSATTAVTLSWDAATDDASPAGAIVYQIFQGAAAGAVDFTTPIATSPAGATSFEVTGLTSGETVFFGVRAQDLTGKTDANTAEQSGVLPTLSLADVQPIFNATCNGGACHVGGGNAAQLKLDAAQAFAELVNKNTSQCGGSRTLVIPGDVANSYLMDKILGVDMCTGVRMPRNRPPLSTDQNNTISDWILQGAVAE